MRAKSCSSAVLGRARTDPTVGVETSKNRNGSGVDPGGNFDRKHTAIFENTNLICSKFLVTPAFSFRSSSFFTELDRASYSGHRDEKYASLPLGLNTSTHPSKPGEDYHG